MRQECEYCYEGLDYEDNLCNHCDGHGFILTENAKELLDFLQKHTNIKVLIDYDD